MSTALGTGPRPAVAAAVLRWGFAGLALVWYALATFGTLGLPNVAIVVVLGVLVMLSVERGSTPATRTEASPRRAEISSWHCRR